MCNIVDRQMCRLYVAYFLFAKCAIMFRLDGWSANSDRLDCKLARVTAGVKRGTSVQFEALKMMPIGKGTEIHFHVQQFSRHGKLATSVALTSRRGSDAYF